MAQAPYSPLMLIAVDGLIQNQGLSINQELVTAIDNYNNINTVSTYTSVLANSIESGLSDSTILSMQTLSSDTFPAVTNAITDSYISAFGAPGNVYSGGLSGEIVSQAGQVLGDGDLSKFVQIYNSARSYIYQNNQVIDSLVNSDLIGNTFSTMTVLTTGGASDLNKDLTLFSQDLKDLGLTWNLNNLNYLGYPWALLDQIISQAGLLPEFINRFVNNGITTTQLSQLSESTSLEVNNTIYQTMQSITSPLLEQVLVMLNVTTPGLTSVADLLNPAKSLPRSYRLLTIRVPDGTTELPFNTRLADVYLSNNTIDSNLLIQFNSDALYQDLAKVIPPDQALANRAIATSLQQIKNIFYTTLPRLADVLLLVETNQNLTIVESLTQPIPPDIRNNLNNILATGTGPNNTITLFDVIGVAAGVPYTELYQQIGNGVTALESAGALVSLTNASTGIWTIMQNTLNGDYDEPVPPVDPEDPPTFIIVIPPPLPGAGTYADLDSAFSSGLIPAAESLINDIATSNATTVSELNSAVTSVVNSLIAEKQNFALLEINLTELTANDRSSILSLGSALHDIGTDIGTTGSARYFEAVATRTDMYGQSILAAMREGRNIQYLNTVGIALDTQIPLITL